VATGNTELTPPFLDVVTVHPRGYGEHFLFNSRGDSDRGSSPWLRGTQQMTSRTRSLSRFIPVATGNTFSTPSVTSHEAVHPRGYGEHNDIGTTRVQLIGSSPWLRGTRLTL